MANHNHTRKFNGDHYFENNPYYSPEKCGLEIVGTAEKEPDWDFSIVLVVKDKKSGKLFAAHDSGCSCPVPFENHRSLADFTLITDPKQLDVLAENGYGIKHDELQSLKRKISRRLRNNG